MHTKPLSLTGWTFGVQGLSCCQRGEVSPSPSPLDTAVSPQCFVILPKCCARSQGTLPSSALHSSVCVRTQQTFFFLFGDKGEGGETIVTELCAVYAVTAFFPALLSFICQHPARAWQIWELFHNFHGGRWRLFFWALKGIIDLCICCFSCGFCREGKGTAGTQAALRERSTERLQRVVGNSLVQRGCS